MKSGSTKEHFCRKLLCLVKPAALNLSIVETTINVTKKGSAYNAAYILHLMLTGVYRQSLLRLYLGKTLTQCSMLSPLLFTLLIHDCSATFKSNHIIKFADDTTVVGLSSDNNETALQWWPLFTAYQWLHSGEGQKHQVYQYAHFWWPHLVSQNQLCSQDDTTTRSLPDPREQDYYCPFSPPSIEALWRASESLCPLSRAFFKMCTQSIFHSIGPLPPLPQVSQLQDQLVCCPPHLHITQHTPHTAPSIQKSYAGLYSAHPLSTFLHTNGNIPVHTHLTPESHFCLSSEHLWTTQGYTALTLYTSPSSHLCLLLALWTFTDEALIIILIYYNVNCRVLC